MQTIYEASILLVDDNPDLLALVSDSLRTAGYTRIRAAAIDRSGIRGVYTADSSSGQLRLG